MMIWRTRLCRRWTRQSGARWASVCVTENYHRPLSESPSLLASDEHSNKKSMKSQSVNTEREKKRELFFHFQTFQLDTEQWNPFPNSSHFSAAQSASDANASSFSQMVALKVTWRLGPGRKALFYTIPAPSKRQVSEKNPQRAMWSISNDPRKHEQD